MTCSFVDYWASRLRFLDVHYHAGPDSYRRRCTAFEAGQQYAGAKGGVVLKSHLGSVSALATAMQALGLPVFGSVVLNTLAGGLSLDTVKQALSQYQFDAAPRLLVHLPTIVRTAHRSALSRTFANEYAREFSQHPLSITDNDGKIRAELKALISFAQHHNIVISSGHTTKDQTLRLIEAVEKAGGCRLMLNQPANPISGFSARELAELGSYDWLYVEQCALTVYLGYQTEEDMYDVLSGVNNVVYSSDLGQIEQPEVSQWLIDSERWFRHAGLEPDQIDAVTRLHPLRMLDPRPSLNSTSG
ncbi:DUF6282 family protein [Lonsdalea quercina]|uniref:DUF6282 family protein n=1 Tax=Lonsdalea quercina TaxID=71657 RepID=UPI003975A59B